MKLNFFKIVFAAALAVVSGVTVYHAQHKEMLSDLTLANVEALARGESSNYHCYSPYTYTCSYELGVRVPGVKGPSFDFNR